MSSRVFFSIGFPSLLAVVYLQLEVNMSTPLIQPNSAKRRRLEIENTFNQRCDEDHHDYQKEDWVSLNRLAEAVKSLDRFGDVYDRVDWNNMEPPKVIYFHSHFVKLVFVGSRN